MAISILKLGDVLVTTIQADLTDAEALQFQQDVVDRAGESNAKGIVIDITAFDLVDSYLARVLNDVAMMLRLIGTEVVISGMRPAVAITLMEMGSDLLGIKTALNLEKGLEDVGKLVARRAAAGRSRLV